MNASTTLPCELFLMRHAKSSWRDDQLSDHDRPLKKRGRQAAQRMAELLKNEGVPLGRIVTSSATRAMETAELIRAAYPEIPLEVEPALYHTERSTWEAWLTRLSLKTSTLVVGHNPGMEDLLEAITSEPVRMPTAAIARLQPIGRSAGLTCSDLKLTEVWRVKEGKEIWH